jgi:hypothetical protein
LNALVGEWSTQAPERAANYVFAVEEPAQRETLATTFAERVRIHGSPEEQFARLRDWNEGLDESQKELAIKVTLKVHGHDIPAPVRRALENGASVDTIIELARPFVEE